MKKPTLRIEEQRPGNIQRDRPYHWVCDDRRWQFQNPIFKRGCCQEGSKRIACELPNAESRSLRRFGEGPNTDKISSLLNSIVSGATLIFTLVASAPLAWVSINSDI